MIDHFAESMRDMQVKPLAVDVIAQAIRSNPPSKTMAASTLAERYLSALYAAGYIVTPRPDGNQAQLKERALPRGSERGE
jgi:hypothetical protein